MSKDETRAPAPRKADQDAEQTMREGADRTDVGSEGWSEVEGSETPPRGGHGSDPAGNVD